MKTLQAGTKRRTAIRRLWSAATIAGVLVASPCLAQPFPSPPDFGLDWVTVGAPGNDPVPDELFIVNSPPAIPLGIVNYEYRIMRTEITVGQWFEFVLAYEPYYTGSPNNPEFTGPGISFILGQYGKDDPNGDDLPTRMSWEFAARYCNWLHNGKAPEQAAFENGAYDTSTFTRNEDGSLNHQQGHHPDARFWIPTHSEWTKAAHYDPNRFGPGQGGYWHDQGSQDEILISGPPGVGQTNAGANGLETAVGQYPNVQSPWGLLDTSGGVTEWTETFLWPDGIRSIIVRASDAACTGYDFRDPIEIRITSGPGTNFFGGRLASLVPPCPGDANGDGVINFADITSVLGAWLSDGSAGGDANSDGVVDFGDITEVLTNWLAPCP